MKLSSKQVAAGAALLGLVAAAYPVAAHHSTTMFDREKFIVLEGTVKELHWTNPHVAIFIENAVAKPGVPDGLWVVELTSPGNLVRSGWTRTLIKPGEKVAVEVHQLRDGSKGGGLRKITVASTGQTFNYNIRDQERPNLEGETYK
ncbi:MAG TPA: DUF6152 family protein [Burkholderiales bacterium]|jgi:hypothetical protein|nr:DUF6152 family protein [Burkholderiales bacterium]